MDADIVAHKPSRVVNIAICYALMGNKALAIDYCQRAIDEGYEEAKETLNDIKDDAYS